MENLEAWRENCDYKDLELYVGDILPLQGFLMKKVDMLESQNVIKPFFLVDLGEFYRMLEVWQRLLPRVEPFYALKCNPHPVVSRFLADAGVGFDCASKITYHSCGNDCDHALYIQPRLPVVGVATSGGCLMRVMQTEIEQILNLGVHPSRIIYANPFKQSDYLTYAARNNIDLMTFDSFEELVKIRKYFPNARLILRISIRNEPTMLHHLSKKFGCHMGQTKTLLAQALEMKLNVVGVSFHVGGPLSTSDCYRTAIEKAYHVFNIGLSLGLNMEILDLGGAFPVKNSHVTFAEVAAVVNESLDKYFPASKTVRIIAEPGRFFVTSAFTLVVSIISKRVVCKQDIEEDEQTNTPSAEAFTVLSNGLDKNGQEGDKRAVSTEHLGDDTTGGEAKEDSLLYMYVLDQGACGSFSNVTYDGADIQLKLLPKEKENDVRSSEPKPSIVWGPTCASFDCVIPECKLSEMEVGQWLYVPDMGAYTLCLATAFNGIEAPFVYPVCSRYYWNKVYPMKEPTSDDKNQGCELGFEPTEQHE